MSQAAPQRTPRGTGLAIGAALLAVVLLVWFLHPGRRPGPPPGAGPSGPAAAPALPAANPAAPGAPPPADAPSHLADALDRPAGDIHEDLRTVEEIFRQYRSSTRQLNPVGENAEITAVLTGRNRLDFAFIPPNHPAINARGELCDRWGTPFFFHALSGTQMEIRSAGPDRKLWTADDVVLTPGLNHPQL
jgi:hypothetical protein